MLTFDDLARLYERPFKIDEAHLRHELADTGTVEGITQRRELQEQRQYWIDLVEEGIAFFKEAEGVEENEEPMEEELEGDDSVIDYPLFKKILLGLLPK